MALVEAAGFSRLLERAEAWQEPVFPLTGKDLIENGIEEGPAVGEAMRRLETAWVDSHFRLDREALLAQLAGEG
jgi:poly(A) polymerase